MPTPRLLTLSLLVTVAACGSPSPDPRDDAPRAGQPLQPVEAAPAAESPQRLVTAMAEKCRATVAGHQNAVVTGEPRAALKREDWVQVDGTMEWRGENGVLRNAWTCDMFRDDDGEWHRRYLSFGPV